MLPTFLRQSGSPEDEPRMARIGADKRRIRSSFLSACIRGIRGHSFLVSQISISIV
jgi:hypothetical protein